MCVCVYLSRVCVCRGWRRTAKGTHIRRILEYGPVEYVCHGVDTHTHTKCAPDNNIHIHMHTHLSISLSLHLNVQKGGLYQYHANHWLFVVFVLFPFLLLVCTHICVLKQSKTRLYEIKKKQVRFGIGKKDKRTSQRTHLMISSPPCLIGVYGTAVGRMCAVEEVDKYGMKVG